MRYHTERGLTRRSMTEGFTLIEFLTVISIIGLLASMIIVSLNSARKAARATRAIADLRQISNALEYYYRDTNSYPSSGGNWDGLYSCWGDSTPDWIVGLTPNYIAELPRSPNNSTDCDKNYIYFSDGKDFKLIWNDADNVDKVVAAYPVLTDPVRSWAFGFYSSSATDW